MRVFPKINNLFFCNNFVRKEGGEGGGKPLADKICKVVLDGFPKAVMKKKYLIVSLNLDEGINVADCWDVVGDERFEFGLQVNLLGGVPGQKPFQ